MAALQGRGQTSGLQSGAWMARVCPRGGACLDCSCQHCAAAHAARWEAWGALPPVRRRLDPPCTRPAAAAAGCLWPEGVLVLVLQCTMCARLRRSRAAGPNRGRPAGGPLSWAPGESVARQLQSSSSLLLHPSHLLSRSSLPGLGCSQVHSIVLADPQAATTADALFLAYRGTDGKSLEPEVYPRPNQQVG